MYVVYLIKEACVCTIQASECKEGISQWPGYTYASVTVSTALYPVSLQSSDDPDASSAIAKALATLTQSKKKGSKFQAASPKLSMAEEKSP